MRNIFAVSTPMQAFNAVEAAHYFNVDNPTVIILTDHFKEADFLPILKSLGDHLLIYNRLPTPQPKTRYFIERFKDWPKFRGVVKNLKELIESLHPVSRVFVGYHDNIWHNAVLNFSGSTEVVALDDGAATVDIVMRRGLERNSWINSPYYYRQYIWNLLLGMKFYSPERMTFFTCYEIDTTKNDKAIRHQYSYLRASIRMADVSDQCFLLGQPLIEQGFLTAETYIEYLEAYRSYLDRPLVYVPHPREHAQVTEDWLRDKNIERRSFALPIEIELAMMDERPGRVAGFFTSAIININAIFGEEVQIDVIRIPEARLLDRREKVRVFYEYLESLTFSSIRILKF